VTNIGRLPKWAQEDIAKLQADVATGRALSWPSYREPQPIDAKVIGYSAIPGWASHFYMNERDCWRVTQGWTNGVSHNVNATLEDSLKRGRSASQGAGRFYLTKVQALQQARIEATQAFARVLANLDAAIEAAENEEF
jgi:hypothetical protein